MRGMPKPKYRVGQQFDLRAVVEGGGQLLNLAHYHLAVATAADVGLTICLTEADLALHRALPTPLAVGDRVYHSIRAGSGVLLMLHNDAAWVLFDGDSTPETVTASFLRLAE